MQLSDTELELTHLAEGGSPGRNKRKHFLDSQGSKENKFLLHLSLLLKKNYIIQRRSPRTLMFQILTPFLVCLLILYWQSLAESVFSGIEIDSKISPISNIQKCFHSLDDPDNCNTIVYSIIVPLFFSVMFLYIF